MTHPTDEDLLAVPRTPAVDDHLRGCPTCERVVHSYATLTRILGDDLTWGLDAIALPLPVQTPSAEEIEIRDLLLQAHSLVESSPAQSLELAERAGRLVASLKGDDQLYRYLFAWFLRERANALRYLGRLHEALLALDAAREQASGLIVSDFELAMISYTRAYLLRELHRYEEALVAGREAAEVFRLFGDKPRELQALFSIANTLLTTGAVEAAIATYASLLERARDLGDPLLMARIHHNLGNAYQQLNRPSEARVHLQDALRAYPESRLRTERTRVRWTLARILQAEGADEALQAFDGVAAEFDALGLVTDAALVVLDSIDVLLSVDPAAAAARAKDLAARFVASGMPVEAATAMAHLREAALKGELTTTLVQDMRLVLRSTLSDNTASR